ncbi:MAG TPA: hypothetical protein PKB14_01705 [Rubrivivax sp.]|nr:hypothetical protein [Rubrivivax sp.]
MHRYDVCNGDADGLCAVLQWRLAHPAEATLVTGLKRDIELLQQVQAQPGDEVLVCDLSMQRNLAALQRVLQQGARVRYFDHHEVDGIPRHAALQAHIDFDPRVCTSLLVDRHLGGRFRAWALVGAYGDNLGRVADALAADMGLDAAERDQLRRLGEAINYNAYGGAPEDQHIAPQRLYALMQRHAQPLQMLRGEAIGAELDALRRADLQQALAQPLHCAGARARWLQLPDAPWSRRVIGSLANELASAEPDLAHAVLKHDGRGGHVVSLRAPQHSPRGADALCRRFGGGGRAGAAGIDHLPAHELPRFVAELAAAGWDGG